MAKSEEKLLARKLRREGESIKVIAKKLLVSVGSVSTWVRDIELSEKQIKNLQKRSTDALFGRKREYLDRLKKEHEEKVNKLLDLGIQKIGKLSKRELFLIGVALYWGEGFKKDSLVGFATSDPEMAKVFIAWMKRCFGTNEKNLILRVTANESYRQNIDAIENFWSHELKINKTFFSKPFYQKTKWKKEYENKDDYHGVLRIRVRKSIDILRTIKGSIKGVALDINSFNFLKGG